MEKEKEKLETIVPTPMPCDTTPTTTISSQEFRQIIARLNEISLQITFLRSEIEEIKQQNNYYGSQISGQGYFMPRQQTQRQSPWTHNTFNSSHFNPYGF